MVEDNNVTSSSSNSQANENAGYQVLISGITWNQNATQYYRPKREKNVELPEQFTLDIPEGKLQQAINVRNKTGLEKEFNDVIETFVYDFLTHKFGHEAYSCSIWLPVN